MLIQIKLIKGNVALPSFLAGQTCSPSLEKGGLPLKHFGKLQKLLIGSLSYFLCSKFLQILKQDEVFMAPTV